MRWKTKKLSSKADSSKLTTLKRSFTTCVLRGISGRCNASGLDQSKLICLLWKSKFLRLLRVTRPMSLATLMMSQKSRMI